MNQTSRTVLAEAEAFVADFVKNKISSDYLFHDLDHTEEVVEAAEEISRGYDLSDREKELILIAAWFHDTGYDEGPENHEERSCRYARKFMSGYDYSEEEIQSVCTTIMATKVPQQPQDLPGEILGDADMSHLGKKSYWDRCGKLRQELLMTRNIIMSEQEWVDFEIDFMTNHRFHTNFAEELYDKRKHKHIRQLIKQKLRLNPSDSDNTPAVAKESINYEKKKDKFKKKFETKEQELKELRLGRGVETMFRTAYRTHVNLSAIADNKANIMLSINAIIISIVISTLFPSFGENPHLIAPTSVLLIVCLGAMIFATLSTRPKVTEGKVTREAIISRKANLLFFGNFYKMPLEDFDWGMREMIMDSDFLYSTMTRDLYFLGIVLAKKYKYLSYCYNVFMYGLIVAVLAFVSSYFFS